MCRRAVRIKSQLKSHRRFAEAFMTYCQLVDNARLYFTNALEGPAKVHISLYLPYTVTLLSICTMHTFSMEIVSKFVSSIYK